MPVFNDYSQDGKLLSTRHEILNPENLERYKQEFGSERIAGYIDCIDDLIKSIELILGTPRPDGGFSPNTPTVIRNKLSTFLIERKNLLETYINNSNDSGTKLSI